MQEDTTPTSQEKMLFFPFWALSEQRTVRCEPYRRHPLGLTVEGKLTASLLCPVHLSQQPMPKPWRPPLCILPGTVFSTCLFIDPLIFLLCSYSNKRIVFLCLGLFTLLS